MGFMAAIAPVVLNLNRNSLWFIFDHNWDCGLKYAAAITPHSQSSLSNQSRSATCYDVVGHNLKNPENNEKLILKMN